MQAQGRLDAALRCERAARRLDADRACGRAACRAVMEGQETGAGGPGPGPAAVRASRWPEGQGPAAECSRKDCVWRGGQGSCARGLAAKLGTALPARHYPHGTRPPQQLGIPHRG